MGDIGTHVRVDALCTLNLVQELCPDIEFVHESRVVWVFRYDGRAVISNLRKGETHIDHAFEVRPDPGEVYAGHVWAAFDKIWNERTAGEQPLAHSTCDVQSMCKTARVKHSRLTPCNQSSCNLVLCVAGSVVPPCSEGNDGTGICDPSADDNVCAMLQCLLNSPGSKVSNTTERSLSPALKHSLGMIEVHNSSKGLLLAWVSEDASDIVAFDMCDFEMPMPMSFTDLFSLLSAFGRIEGTSVADELDFLFSDDVDAIIQLFQETVFVAFGWVFVLSGGVPCYIQLGEPVTTDGVNSAV